jgi:hypothetical protein
VSLPASVDPLENHHKSHAARLAAAPQKNRAIRAASARSRLDESASGGGAGYDYATTLALIWPDAGPEEPLTDVNAERIVNALTDVDGVQVVLAAARTLSWHEGDVAESDQLTGISEYSGDPCLIFPFTQDRTQYLMELLLRLTRDSDCCEWERYIRADDGRVRELAQKALDFYDADPLSWPTPAERLFRGFFRTLGLDKEFELDELLFNLGVDTGDVTPEQWLAALKCVAPLPKNFSGDALGHRRGSAAVAEILLTASDAPIAEDNAALALALTGHLRRLPAPAELSAFLKLRRQLEDFPTELVLEVFDSPVPPLERVSHPAAPRPPSR